jgi:twinkle protein
MTLQAKNMIDFVDPLMSLYRSGMAPGASTGWGCVDSLYTVALGQWSVITGVPGHGKSEWLDALMVNLLKDGWQHVIFSPENQPHEMHVAKFLEKWINAPFAVGPTPRMSEDQIVQGMMDIDIQNRISFLTVDAEFVGMPSIASVLSACHDVVDTWRGNGSGKKVGLVIDPWNELDHARPGDRTETEYISKTLSTIRQFARDLNIHVWVVAHPTKIAKDKDGKRPVPSLWDIAGSAHWYNKADNGITIWRDVVNGGPVQIHVQKIRFKNIGKPGVAELNYDRVTGNYYDPTNQRPRLSVVQPGDSTCPL